MSMDITLLTDEQMWGDKALQVMKSYGTKVGMSDLAVLLGGVVSSSNTTTNDGQKTGFVWSTFSYVDRYVRAVNYNGDRDFNHTRVRYCGTRPALPSSVASSIGLHEAKPSRKISWVDVVEYGEYPQTIAGGDLEKEGKSGEAEKLRAELEQAFSRNQLQKTGKRYNFDRNYRYNYDSPFDPKEHAEYQHKGKKYIRVEAKPYGEGYSMLSNGEQAQAGQSYWVEVQPIEWLRDPSGICVARQALFAGVQFDSKIEYDGNFENTDMKRYLQNYFAKEMQVRPLLVKPSNEIMASPALESTSRTSVPSVGSRWT